MEILDRAAVEGLSDEDAHAAKDLLERCGACAGASVLGDECSTAMTR